MLRPPTPMLSALCTLPSAGRTNGRCDFAGALDREMNRLREEMKKLQNTTQQGTRAGSAGVPRRAWSAGALRSAHMAWQDSLSAWPQRVSGAVCHATLPRFSPPAARC